MVPSMELTDVIRLCDCGAKLKTKGFTTCEGGCCDVAQADRAEVRMTCSGRDKHFMMTANWGAEFREVRHAYVGGLGDGRNEFVKRMFDHHSKTGDAYFEHHQTRALANWIDRNNSSCSTTVIGHSYGGHSAIKVVLSGHRIDHLITVDPVGRFKPDYAEITQHAKKWTNYVAIGGGLNRNNLIARLGGWYGHKPKGYADNHIAIDKDHVDICFECCRPSLKY